MAQKTAIRKHPAVPETPNHWDIPSTKEVRSPDGLTARLASVAQELLAVTYWFDPAPQPKPYPVTIRFSGHRVDVKKGRLRAGDRFVQNETIEEVIPGSGPISVTTRVRNINPGQWHVTAQVLSPPFLAHGQREQGNAMAPTDMQSPLIRFWRRWGPDVSLVESVNTCPAPFVRVPGTLPGVWGAMVGLGIIIALVLQSLVISSSHLVIGPWWIVSLVAILGGMIGAKGWFIIKHRDECRLEGWCIQGFIVAATLTAALLLVVFHLPAGVFLDATTPGLLFAMAVGRVGCFLAGCCGGPPTASRFGIWSSDQRVGARRLPTQLLESALAGSWDCWCWERS